MKCNQCSSCDTKVIESRDVSDGVATRRRRACIDCEHRFTTYERVEWPQIIVIKSDGKRELFKREKLLNGLYKACEKTAITNLQIERIVNDIEKHLYSCGEQEIKSNQLGELVMEHLAETDDVAYVRFASVYRQFKDIESFEKELEQIKTKRKGLAKA